MKKAFQEVMILSRERDIYMPNAIPKVRYLYGYLVYFWSDESKPLEPIHIHLCKGTPSQNATKYWILEDGTIKLEHNKSRIPQNDLKKLEKAIKEYSMDIIKNWENYFKEAPKFYTE